MADIGRLVHSTNQICGDCESGKLQIRGRKIVVTVKGEELTEETKYLYCPVCEYEEVYLDKKEKNKHREIKEVKEVKSAYNKKSNGIKSRPNGNFNRGNK
jgi:Zn finger protein HypA/HybF involved in hydrogenase expression